MSKDTPQPAEVNKAQEDLIEAAQTFAIQIKTKEGTASRLNAIEWFIAGAKWQASPPDAGKKQEAVAILIELCKLKHYKDTVGKDSFYEKRQPELWKLANDFLNKR